MSQESINATRILALHVRPQRFGFAVFKGPAQLLDWGGSVYVSRNGASSILVAKRIDALLAIYAPLVVVVRNITDRGMVQSGNLRSIVGIVKQQARRHYAKFVSVGQQEVQRAFRPFGKTTKYDIAAQVAILFSELMWKLPPPRKAWEKEHHNMAIFDAVALGVTYFSRFGLHLRDVSEDFQEVA